MSNNVNTERKPYLIVLFDEIPPQKVTFLDYKKHNGEVVSITPMELDWKLGKQRADLGTFEGTHLCVFGSVEYSSYTTLVDEVRKIVPEVEVIKTIVPDDAKGRVVIY